MRAFLTWLGNFIDSFFYGKMSSADLRRMSRDERQERLDEMVDASGDIKGVAKRLNRTLEQFQTDLARSRGDLDRENAALYKAQQDLSANPTDEKLQFRVQALQRSVGLAGSQVTRWLDAIKDLKAKSQNLEIRDQTAEYAVHWQDFQNRFARATDAIMESDEAYRDSMRQVVASQKVLSGVGKVSAAEAFLERRRDEIASDIDKYEGRSEVLDGLMRQRVLSSENMVSPDVAAAIEDSRKRLGLPDPTISASAASSKEAVS